MKLCDMKRRGVLTGPLAVTSPAQVQRFVADEPARWAPVIGSLALNLD
jgi:hypothetical protein